MKKRRSARKPKPKFNLGEKLYSSNCVVFKRVTIRYCSRSGGERCEECGHYIRVSYNWDYGENGGVLPEHMLRRTPWPGVEYRD
jgi:hypothetical protein